MAVHANWERQSWATVGCLMQNYTGRRGISNVFFPFDGPGTINPVCVAKPESRHRQMGANVFHSASMPQRMAYAAASVRFVLPVLARMLRTCVATVLRLMHRVSAIS